MGVVSTEWQRRAGEGEGGRLSAGRRPRPCGGGGGGAPRGGPRRGAVASGLATAAVGRGRHAPPWPRDGRATCGWPRRGVAAGKKNTERPRGTSVSTSVPGQGAALFQWCIPTS